MLTYGSMAVKNDKVYTYEDYLSFNENTRCEILDGYLFMMASPLRIYQQVLSHLMTKIYNFLDGKPCGVYAAPFLLSFFESKT